MLQYWFYNYTYHVTENYKKCTIKKIWISNNAYLKYYIKFVLIQYAIKGKGASERDYLLFRNNDKIIKQNNQQNVFKEKIIFIINF